MTTLWGTFGVDGYSLAVIIWIKIDVAGCLEVDNVASLGIAPSFEFMFFIVFDCSSLLEVVGTWVWLFLQLLEKWPICNKSYIWTRGVHSLAIECISKYPKWGEWSLGVPFPDPPPHRYGHVKTSMPLDLIVNVFSKSVTNASQTILSLAVKGKVRQTNLDQNNTRDFKL